MLLMVLVSFFQISNSFAQSTKIDNFFSVDPEGQVFRGREPKAKNISFLEKKGITDVIIFKNDLRGEVPAERKLLKEAGIKAHLIAFKWKEIEAVEACEQVLTALKLIEKIKRNQGKVYFHCTVGQDRTGLLAGLWRIYNQDWAPQKAFRSEMCARGYSDAIKEKVPVVSSHIEAGLTPLFEYLAPRLESKKSLDAGVCKGLRLKESALRCHS